MIRESNEWDVYRIWLRDAATVLGMWNRNPSSPYYLHGFDISSAQFQPVPTQTNAEISLSLQNCLEPFPSEHHGRYDFVHVRLLIGALRKGEYELAIKNIFDILSMDQWPSCFKMLVTDSMQNPVATSNGKKPTWTPSKAIYPPNHQASSKPVAFSSVPWKNPTSTQNPQNTSSAKQNASALATSISRNTIVLQDRICGTGPVLGLLGHCNRWCPWRW